jgi:hypothetical protein
MSILDLPLFFSNAIICVTLWRLPYFVCMLDALDIMPFYAESTKAYLEGKRSEWKNNIGGCSSWVATLQHLDRISPETIRYSK